MNTGFHQGFESEATPQISDVSLEQSEKQSQLENQNSPVEKVQVIYFSDFR